MVYILTGCSNEESKAESSYETIVRSSISFKHNQQEFEIINYYQEFLDFLKEVKEQPTNKENLYRQSVTESLKQNGVGYDLLSNWMFTTPADITALELAINQLIKEQDSINDSIKEALIDSATLLPGENKMIHVVPAIPELSSVMQEMNYVFGVVGNKDFMLILIDPAYTEEDLKLTVAHEYHHTVYKENPNSGYNLLVTSLVEGKADTFTKIVYPNSKVAWAEPLLEEESQKVWDIFMENLETNDSSFIAGFTDGNSYYGIPKWSTYKIGNQIMQSFLEDHPGLSIEEWTKTPEIEIFHQSKFNID